MSDLNKKVTIRIEIPQDVFDNYERQSQQCNKTAEQVIAERLDKCKWHTDLSPLYFSDHWKHELEVVLSKSFTKAPDVVKYLADTKAIRFSGGPVKIIINDTLMKRLQTRKFGLPLEKVIEREALQGLEKFVGLR